MLIGSPKSRTSVRTILVPSFLLTLLEKKKRQDFLYLITGKSKPAEPRTMQYRFQKILKLCGIRKVPFHLLRHTYATDCIAHGFDAKTLSELLGHADASITIPVPNSNTKPVAVHTDIHDEYKKVKRFSLVG